MIPIKVAESICRANWLVGICLLATGHLDAQERLDKRIARYGVKLLSVAAIQRPVDLDAYEQSSRHMAKHLFVGVQIEEQLSKDWRVGIGGGLSWGAYGVRATRVTQDAGGTNSEQAEFWTEPVWFPFEPSSYASFKLKTDPFQFWIEVLRSLRLNTRSAVEVSALAGAMPPTGIYLSTSVDIGNFQHTDRTFAETGWGDSWYVFVGSRATYSYQIAEHHRIAIGLDLRMTTQPYFDLSLSLDRPGQPSLATSKQVRFVWLGATTSYTFSWADHNANRLRKQERMERERDSHGDRN